MRRLTFAVHDVDMYILETGVFEEAVDFHFSEAEPDVGIEFAGLFEVVFQKIEDDDAPAWTGDAEGLTDSMCGLLRVVEGLTEKGEVHGGVFDGRRLDVAETIFQIGETVLLRDARSVSDHFFGTVHGDDLFRAAGEELRECAFTGSEVGDGLSRQQQEEGFGEAFPTATGTITASEFSGELIEVSAGGIGAVAESKIQRLAVTARLGQFGGAFAEDIAEAGAARVERIEAVLSRPAHLYEASAFQQREMRADAALFHAEDFLQFRDGEFRAVKQQQQAQPGGLAEKTQGFENGRHTRQCRGFLAMPTGQITGGSRTRQAVELACRR